MRRRNVLRTVGGAGLASAVAGCGGGGDTGGVPRGDTEVLVDPNGGDRFEPETLTIDAGETVTWRFERSGHNVSCVPEHHEDNALPEGAEPFASYQGDALQETAEEGATYEHTVDVAGEYDYVCIPHAPIGMAGTIVVEE